MKSKKPYIQPVSLPAIYGKLLKDLKARVRSAQAKAATVVNRELISLYWDIGKAIAEVQKGKGYGERVVERLGRDLSREFPEMKGLSVQNLWRMRAFYLAYTDEVKKLAQAVRESPHTKLAQAVRELPQTVVTQLKQELNGRDLPLPLKDIPWGHNIVLLQKLKEPSIRLWYAHQASQQGWSRAVLMHHIETKLHIREGKAITNFRQTLPPSQSDLAQQTIKDPYIFDFLTISADAQERDLEQGLLDHIGRFLLELGVGFAFVGRQYHLEVDGQDYYLDLLFYHLRLRCFVVIDLKMEPFKPEFAGKMNFYLSAVDDQMRQNEDNPTIGLLLCKERHKLTVEYALRDMRKPIGVAEWQTKLVESLPKKLKGKLPTIEQIEQELSSTKKKKV